MPEVGRTFVAPFAGTVYSLPVSRTEYVQQGDRLLQMALAYYKGVGTPAALDRLRAMAGDAKLSEAIRKAATEAAGGSQ